MTWSAPMTAVTGTLFSAAQFNQYVRDNLNDLHTTHGWKVWKSGAAPTLTTGVALLVTFDQELLDSDNYHDTVTNPSRATVPTGYAGTYVLSAVVGFNSSAAGSRQISFLKNGAIVATNTQGPTPAGGFWMGFTAIVPGAAVGDYFEVQATQSSGGNLTLLTTNSYDTWFSGAFQGA